MRTLCLFFFSAVLRLGSAQAEETPPTVHGPIIQWHRDPLTSATFTWIERDPATEGQTSTEWQWGRAGFGYGDGDDATEFKDQLVRVYAATQFAMKKLPAAGSGLVLQVDYDDAFVAYLNGVEVARSPNLKGAGKSAKVTGTHEAGKPERFEIPAKAARLGPNLLSIEVHNSSLKSSDLTLIPLLKAGAAVLVGPETDWAYLAGRDPEAQWYLRRPEVKNEPQSAPRPPAPTAWKLVIHDRASGIEVAAPTLSGKRFGEAPSMIFHAVATGLEPSHAYRYELAVSSGETIREGWFRTAPAALDPPMSWVTGGDMGTEAAKAICRLAGTENPVFALIGGDLAYANGKEDAKWYDWFDNWHDLVVGEQGRTIPMIAGIGNHETKDGGLKPENAPFYFAFADLPEGKTCFSVDFGDYLSIVNLDSNHVLRVEEQTDWLDGQLKARADRLHLIACYHRPAYGTGVKGNIIEIQNEWAPLFEKHGVDVVFENDHHVYKRTHRLVGGQPDPAGVLYLGDGAWGAGPRKISDRGIRKIGADKYLAHWAAENHLIRVTLWPDGQRHYEAKRADGTIIDETQDPAGAERK